jgi:anti-sigma factor RsiW
MDCAGLNDRIAAYLDGQLGCAETDLVESHLERCPDCVRMVEVMGAQEFAPLSADERAKRCGAADFWSAMDTALSPSLEHLAPVCEVTQRWTRRQVELPLPMVVAYAAAFGLAVVWGARQMERADDASQSVEALGQQLEQERRQAAEPQAVPRPQPYRLVTHTPQRGTF